MATLLLLANATVNATSCANEDGDPPLVVDPARLLGIGGYVTILILFFMLLSMLQPLANAARVASGGAGAVPTYSHYDTRTQSWTPFSEHICAIIADEQDQRPGGGSLRLPNLPFEVKWGSEATSPRMLTAPASGMIQVNIHTMNTRIVRREAAGVSTADRFEARVFFRPLEFTAAKWRWMRYLDIPWLVATFEGESFHAFVVVLIFESILNATNTANTHLEGDLFFSNDPYGVVVVGSWFLSVMDCVSIAVLLTQMRREAGKRCCCLLPYKPEADADAKREAVLVSVAWFTFVHDAFQMLFAAAATVSQARTPHPLTLTTLSRILRRTPTPTLTLTANAACLPRSRLLAGAGQQLRPDGLPHQCHRGGRAQS